MSTNIPKYLSSRTAGRAEESHGVPRHLIPKLGDKKLYEGSASTKEAVSRAPNSGSGPNQPRNRQPDGLSTEGKTGNKYANLATATWNKVLGDDNTSAKSRRRPPYPLNADYPILKHELQQSWDSLALLLPSSEQGINQIGDIAEEDHSSFASSAFPVEPKNSGSRVVTSPTNTISHFSPPHDDYRTMSLASGRSQLRNAYPSLSPNAGHQSNFAQQRPAILTSQSHRDQKLSNSGNPIHHTFSLSSKSRSFSSLSKLSSLSTKRFNSSLSLQQNKPERNLSSGSLQHQASVGSTPKKFQVYPALLSRLAMVFKETIVLSMNTKDGLVYHDTFTGRQAVDVLCKIIRTNDRNLAILLGRTLDAQKLFHDVTYNHRIRDSVHEVYAFTHSYSGAEFFPDEESGYTYNNSGYSKNSAYPDSPQLDQGMMPLSHSSTTIAGQSSSTSTISNQLNEPAPIKESPTSVAGVNGVFTILTNCYSPTCSRNRLCYSISCPRRLEQQARLNLNSQSGLKRVASRLSFHETEEKKSLWHETVPQSILDKLDKKEKMRQELIYEFINTEKDFVKDLEFMTEFYIYPLRNPANHIIPERERQTFIRIVFGGVSDLLRLGKSMCEDFTRRQQQEKPIIENFADIFLDHVGNFEPFIRYSGNKVFASFENERQQQVNFRYARFLDALERRPESKRQDLSSLLIKGVQRPARYQLLLQGILKNTKPESPDYRNLVKAKEEIEKLLNKINIQTGKSTDRHKIMVLHRLIGKQVLEEDFHFKLNYEDRIIYQATLNRKRDNEKVEMYLFQHALLLVKHKVQNKRDHYKVFEKPIYLPLLFANSGPDIPTNRSILNHRYEGSLLSDTNLRNRVENTYINSTLMSGNKYSLNFLGLGHTQVHTTLFVDDMTNQKQILNQIYQVQKSFIEQNDIFSITKYETRRFHGNNRLNCAVPCYGGKKLLYGTDSGVWVSTVRSISANSNERICSDPMLVISKGYVTQMEVLVEYSLLLILSDKALYQFDLSCTDSLDHTKNTKSGKLILHNVSFFKTGISEGRLLVCAAKAGSTNTVNIFEPTNPFDNKVKNKNKKYDIKELSFNSSPVSISFLRKLLCIGCTKGFYIVSLEEKRIEPILDEADPSLDFAIHRENVSPLAIYKLGNKILLCYSEFSFKINNHGWRTSHDWLIFWEGIPQNVALFYPYLVAFEPGFIEVRDLESTTLLRALVGENIRYLYSNEHEALYACEENGYDVIISIDFLNLKPRS